MLTVVLLAGGLATVLTIVAPKPAAAAPVTTTYIASPINDSANPANWKASWGIGGSCGSVTYTCMTDYPDTTGASYWNSQNKATTSGYMGFTATPANTRAVSSVLIEGSGSSNSSGVVNGRDFQSFQYQVMQSDATTPLTTACTGADSTGNTILTTVDNEVSCRATPLGNNTKSVWDSAVLKIDAVYAVNGGADTTSKGQPGAARLTITYTLQPPAMTQSGYIWENDDQSTGANANSDTAQAAGNASISSVSAGERLTLRTQMKNTGSAAEASAYGLFYDRNDNYWTKVQPNAPPITSAGSCADTNFSCSTVDSSSTEGAETSTAVDSKGNPWIAYSETTNFDLRVATYVGSGGNCGTASAWRCLTVDSTSTTGDKVAIGISPTDDSAWIAYHSTTSTNLHVAHYVASGGTGCSDTAWTCTTIDQTAAEANSQMGIAFSGGGAPWISYYDSTGHDLRIAQYVISGGSGCTSTAWTCVSVDTTNDVGQYSAIAFSATGKPWVSYFDVTNTTLRVAQYVGTGGTGCAIGVTWTCQNVDPGGSYSSIAFDPSGNAWVSYYSTASGILKYAQYVGASGSGCTSSAWTCGTADNNSNTGQYTSIAFDPAGHAWISEWATVAQTLKLARYVGSSGSGCGAGITAWSCTTIDNSAANVGAYSSLAFAPDGTAWIGYNDGTNSDIKAASLNRRGEIVPSAGVAGTQSAAVSLTTSHADMTAVSDTTNQGDADCIGGGAWVNGAWVRNGETTLSLAGSSCTELGWMIDTAPAQTSTTYRFVVATKDGPQQGNAMWRGPATISQFPTLATAASTTARYAKDITVDLAACTAAAWGCADIVNTNNTDVSFAFAPDGVPWYSFRTASLLKVSHYVGSGGNCSNTAWQCDSVDGYTSAVANPTTSIVFDPSGTAWMSYINNSGYAAVAKYVTSGGTGCSSSTAWTCVGVKNVGTTYGRSSLAVGTDGAPWLAFEDSSDNIEVAKYVGVSGSGCTDIAWSCTTLTSDTKDLMPSIALDNYGKPWISYMYNNTAVSVQGLWAAHYVGAGGSGCAANVTAWTCESVKKTASGTNPAGDQSSITFDNSNNAWISSVDQAFAGAVVSQYVGSSGSGCGAGITAWTCTAVDSSGADKRSSIAVDGTGTPWFSYNNGTNLYVAQYVSSGGNCTSSAWKCTAVDNGGASTSGQANSLAFDRLGSPWVIYNKISGATRAARLLDAPTQPVANAKTINPGRSAGATEGRYHLDSGGSPRGTCAATANAKGYCGVQSNDSDYDGATAIAGEIPVVAASAYFLVTAPPLNISWTGQSTVAPSSKAITVKVWHGGATKAWETLTIATNTCSAAAANTSCTITGANSGGTPSEYYETIGGVYYAYVRVSQAASAETLKTNVLSITQTNIAPTTPTSIAQTTNGSTPIGTGNWIGQNSVVFTGSVADQNNPDTDALCVEAVTGTFSNSDTGCGTGVSYSGTPVATSVTLSGLAEGQYKWQARTKDTGPLYSSYSQFNGGSTSFKVDRTGPSTGTVYDGSSAGVDAALNDGTLTTLSGNWSGFADTGGSGVATYSYSIGTSAGATDILTWTGTASTSFTASSLNIHTGQLYFVNVKAIDAVGNVGGVVSSNGQQVAPTLTFSVSPSSITFNNLNVGNGRSNSQSVTATTTTNGYSGFVVRQYMTGSLSTGTYNMPNYAGTYASPTSWAGTGFGYTSDDTTIQASGNIFNGGGAGGRFAALTTTNPGDIVGDSAVSQPSGQNTGLLYKVVAPSNQQAGRYTTSIALGATVTF